MRRTTFLALFLLLPLFLAGGACPQPLQQRALAPADTAAGEVEMRLAGPGGAALVVPVRINGEGPFDFVLDTGATITCVDQRLVDRLKLQPRPLQRGVGAGIEGVGEMAMVRVDSIEVGTARATNMSAAVLDLAHMKQVGVEIDGLVGINFLRNYLVTLDFGRNVVRFEERGAAERT